MARKFEHVRSLALRALDSDGKALLKSLNIDDYPAYIQSLNEAIAEYEAIDPQGLEVDNLKFVGEVVNLFFYMTNDCIEVKTRALELKPDSFKTNEIPSNISVETALRWSRRKKWTNTQAALLSMGFDPRAGVGFSFEESLKLFSFVGSSVYEEIRDRLYFLNEHSTDIRLLNGSPPDFLDWFFQMRFSFPAELARQTELIYKSSRSVDENKDDFSAVERKTVLRLLLGMAIRGYGFDPAKKRNSITKDIVADLDFLGIGLDPKTILKWLRIAAEEVELDSNP